MSWRLLQITAVSAVLLLRLGAGALADAAPPNRDPNLDDRDVTMAVVLSIQWRLAMSCKIPFDREALFARHIAVRTRKGVPEATLTAARAFWRLYSTHFDRISAERGFQNCSDEFLRAFRRAQKRIDMELK